MFQLCGNLKTKMYNSSYNNNTITNATYNYTNIYYPSFLRTSEASYRNSYLSKRTKRIYKELEFWATLLGMSIREVQDLFARHPGLPVFSVPIPILVNSKIDRVNFRISSYRRNPRRNSRCASIKRKPRCIKQNIKHFRGKCYRNSMRNRIYRKLANEGRI